MSKSPLQHKHISYFDYEHDPSWRIFRIMSEFVDGFTFLSNLRKTVTFFGSSRLQETHPYYKMSRQLGRMLAEKGLTIVTGGGPGIMEAGNRGARDADGVSVGLNIQLPYEQRINPYVTHGTSFSYFFSRKVMLDFSALAYIFFPGGFGTLDELFEVLTLIQTGKIEAPAPPVFLIGVKYWAPLIEWIRSIVFHEHQAISAGDLEIWTLTDDLEAVVHQIEKAIERNEALQV